MTDEIKSMVLKALKIYGVKRVRKVYLKSLDDSIKLKNKMLSQGSPLYNIPNHIELNNEILDFITEYEIEERDRKINSLIEKRVLSFSTFIKQKIVF